MIPITPDVLRATYEYLVQLPPFDKWNLPASSKLTFYVVEFKSEHAEYNPEKKTIRVSKTRVSSFLSLVAAMCHEMVHVRQDVAGRYPVKDMHNQDFKKYTRQVCKHFPFLDPLNL